MILTPGDLDIGWRTVWMEARNQGYAGMLAVAWVLRNRMEWKSHDRWNTIAQVCLDWLQFSGWREDDPNFVAAQAEPMNAVARECVRALCEALDGDKTLDPTHGSRHYFAPAGLKTLPGWAYGHKPAVVIGDHEFFNDIA